MARCKVFSFRDGLTEMVADGLYLKAVVGETMSVGVVSFVEAAGAAIPSSAHAHGEEITLQILGGCTVHLGDGSGPPAASVELEQGSVMVMPAEQPHFGVNRFDAEGQCLRLNVVSPPRQEYGAKGAEKVFYPIAEPQR